MKSNTLIIVGILVVAVTILLVYIVPKKQIQLTNTIKSLLGKSEDEIMAGIGAVGEDDADEELDMEEEDESAVGGGVEPETDMEEEPGLGTDEEPEPDMEEEPGLGTDDEETDDEEPDPETDMEEEDETAVGAEPQSIDDANGLALIDAMSAPTAAGAEGPGVNETGQLVGNSDVTQESFCAGHSCQQSFCPAPFNNEDVVGGGGGSGDGGNP